MDVARACPFLVNREASEEAQSWIFFTQLTREIEAAAANEIVICDRTVFDSLAYSAVQGYKDFTTMMWQFAMDWRETYDELYWLRPDQGTVVADDGFRDPDPDYQRLVDTTFEVLYSVGPTVIRCGKDGWTGDIKMGRR